MYLRYSLASHSIIQKTSYFGFGSVHPTDINRASDKLSTTIYIDQTSFLYSRYELPVFPFFQTSLRYIDDHRPLIEDINNTGQEVKVLCQQEEAAKVQGLLDKVNSKYDEVKSDIRNRWVSFDFNLHNLTTSMVEGTSVLQ